MKLPMNFLSMFILKREKPPLGRIDFIRFVRIRHAQFCQDQSHRITLLVKNSCNRRLKIPKKNQFGIYRNPHLKSITKPIFLKICVIVSGMLTISQLVND